MGFNSGFKGLKWVVTECQTSKHQDTSGCITRTVKAAV